MSIISNCPTDSSPGKSQLTARQLSVAVHVNQYFVYLLIVFENYINIKHQISIRNLEHVTMNVPSIIICSVSFIIMG